MQTWRLCMMDPYLIDFPLNTMRNKAGSISHCIHFAHVTRSDQFILFLCHHQAHWLFCNGLYDTSMIWCMISAFAKRQKGFGDWYSCLYSSACTKAKSYCRLQCWLQEKNCKDSSSSDLGKQYTYTCHTACIPSRYNVAHILLLLYKTRIKM